MTRVERELRASESRPAVCIATGHDGPRAAAACRGGPARTALQRAAALAARARAYLHRALLADSLDNVLVSTSYLHLSLWRWIKANATADYNFFNLPKV